MEPSPYRLALAQNVATNGRLFCAILAAANFSAGWHLGVAAVAVPVGLAWASDIVSGGLKGHLAAASIGTAIALAIATLVNCW